MSGHLWPRGVKPWSVEEEVRLKAGWITNRLARFEYWTIQAFVAAKPVSRVSRLWEAFLDGEYNYWKDDHPDDSDDSFEGLQ